MTIDTASHSMLVGPHAWRSLCIEVIIISLLIQFSTAGKAVAQTEKKERMLTFVLIGETVSTENISHYEQVANLASNMIFHKLNNTGIGCSLFENETKRFQSKDGFSYDGCYAAKIISPAVRISETAHALDVYSLPKVDDCVDGILKSGTEKTASMNIYSSANSERELRKALKEISDLNDSFAVIGIQAISEDNPTTSDAPNYQFVLYSKYISDLVKSDITQKHNLANDKSNAICLPDRFGLVRQLRDLIDKLTDQTVKITELPDHRKVKLLNAAGNLDSVRPISSNNSSETYLINRSLGINVETVWMSSSKKISTITNSKDTFSFREMNRKWHRRATANFVLGSFALAGLVPLGLGIDALVKNRTCIQGPATYDCAGLYQTYTAGVALTTIGGASLSGITFGLLGSLIEWNLALRN